MRNSHVRWAAVLLLAIAGVLGTAHEVGALVEPELLVAVPPTGGYTPQFVEAVEVRDLARHELVFLTQNVGASCGGGTPAAVWKLVLDPATGLPVSLQLKQTLSEIQQGRGVIFESAGGTIFTGGGWCGHKPPYVSTDGGDTWRAATNGTHPPNSTFAYGEHAGQVYAGTGYEPYHAQVYRWLGGPADDWALMLDIPPPRSIVDAIVSYRGRMFVSSYISWWNGGQTCPGSVPVYVSEDGVAFQPTAGIPSCWTFESPGLVVARGVLIAFTRDYNNPSDRDLYRWDDAASQWVLHADFPLAPAPTSIRPVATDGRALYVIGGPPGDPVGLYVSRDLGQSWALLAPWNGPPPCVLSCHFGTLYVSTHRDGSHDASIYTVVPEIEVALDIKPGSCPNPFNPRSHGITPAALLGAEDLDVGAIDAGSLRLAGTVAPVRHAVEDVGRPGVGGDCPCSTEGPDGHPDLTLKFRTEELVAALGPLARGQQVVVAITGALRDGTPLRGTDCLTIVGKHEAGQPGRCFTLGPARPNPFNPSVEIAFSLVEARNLDLAVFDADGRRIATLAQGSWPAGEHAARWSAGRHASGVYFVRLDLGDEVEVQKITLLR